ncbi:diguanylate cyclase (GGDEF)-like protein [Motilibacter peucedani]|uniref:Diguanylate cyclase (GGDEF)-like protein n=1 Tax=Motilibacter peucedani TaxID=598650 RepID=A0A420XNY8_9ACTN|nr:bifunctional diguanylate cyclase/phosphodiesterase [Motilibacter peucedani]RKS73882.1 diguanylate cyclase (GGDEF)-like protein [Motilibacter peucedani]
MTRAQLARRGGTWPLVLAVAGCSAVLHVVVTRSVAGAAVASSWHWWELVPAFVLAELCVVHVQFGREAHSFALSEIPLVIGLFTLSPTHVVVARLLGGAAALALRRQPAEKLLFNCAQWWLDTLLAVAIWRALAGDGPGLATSPRAWVAAIVAVAVAELVSTGAILAAIWVREGAVPTGLAVRGLLEGQLVSLTNVSFGLVAFDLLRTSWRNAWVLLVVGAAVWSATRAHVKLQRRHRLVESLNRFSHGVGEQLELEATVAYVLERTRELLVADSAALVLSPGFVGAEGTSRTFACDASGVRELTEHHPGTPQVPESADELESALDGPDGRIGVLSVHDRLGDVGGFGTEDAALLEAIAGQAASWLHNSRLADLLREQAAASDYRALHDPLTGLPNRVLFTRAVDDACGRGTAAVLLLDLNRFKEVNDTLGHAAGDDLLREVARRLRAMAAPDTCVSRLGGDEFAVLLRGAGANEALVHAGQVRDALMAPLPMSGISFRMEASTGIAVSPQHGTTSEALLRCADVAMYYAKSTRTPAQVYTPRADVNSAARLALVSDLRWALLNEEFRLQYQPKVSIVEGRVTSLEALIRWHDPVRGVVGPDTFIPVAEQVGLISDLTDWVLATSLRQCRAWQDQGSYVSVAVNVSPPTLHDTDFVQGVRRHLELAGIPPHRLTLEITEGAVMRDPAHALRVLHDLRALGVRLSIDDLGAGQSSLTYLRQLPVDEVKIDKSFVMGMSEVADDDAIVCALVNLVHTLRLAVVAEGVEDERTWQRLRQIGCDTAQGYWLSRPLDPELVPGWLGAPHRYIDLLASERGRRRLSVAGGTAQQAPTA